MKQGDGCPSVHTNHLKISLSKGIIRSKARQGKAVSLRDDGNVASSPAQPPGCHCHRFTCSTAFWHQVWHWWVLTKSLVRHKIFTGECLHKKKRFLTAQRPFTRGPPGEPLDLYSRLFSFLLFYSVCSKHMLVVQNECNYLCETTKSVKKYNIKSLFVKTQVSKENNIISRIFVKNQNK